MISYLRYYAQIVTIEAHHTDLVAEMIERNNNKVITHSRYKI